MSVWDVAMGKTTLKDIEEQPGDTIVCINISEEARAQVENSKDPETIEMNINNLMDGIASEIIGESMALLEDQE